MPTEPVPCHVEHEYARRTTATYSGADHIVLDGPLVTGRLRRDVGDALCKTRHKFRDLQPTGHRRQATCATCTAKAARLVDAGLLDSPVGGERLRSLPCLGWENFRHSGDPEICQRCDHCFADHTPEARLAGWLGLAVRWSERRLDPLEPPAFLAAELVAAADDPGHPCHHHPGLGRTGPPWRA